MSEPAHSSKRPALHVLGIVIEIFAYCLRNARRLFVVAWLPCALLLVNNLALEWLTLGWPPRMPRWAISNQFHPPTWLSPLTMALWSAMVFAFVLDGMRQSDSSRGIVSGASFRLTWIRFEISLPVLLAAAILSIEYFVEEFARFAQVQALVAIVVASGITSVTGSEMEVWATLSSIPRLLLIAGSTAICYSMAAQAIETGRIDVARLWRCTRGNWLRLVTILLLIHLILLGLDEIVSTVTQRLLQTITDPLNWSLREAFLRSILNFPFDLVWIVTWPVAIGVAFSKLDCTRQERSAEPQKEN